MRPSRGSSTVSPSRSQPSDRRRFDRGQRRVHPASPAADDGEGLAIGAGHGQVAPLDDRGLLPCDRGDRRPEPVHVVEGDVRDRGDAAVPGVRRVEPPAEPDLDERDVDAGFGEMAEDDRGQQLELGRLAVPSGDAVRDRQHRLDVRVKSSTEIGRPSIWTRSR